MKHQNLQLNITKNMATLVGLSLEQFNLVAIDIKKTKDKLTSSLSRYFADIDQTKMHSIALTK